MWSRDWILLVPQARRCWNKYNLGLIPLLYRFDGARNVPRVLPDLYGFAGHQRSGIQKGKCRFNKAKRLLENMMK